MRERLTATGTAIIGARTRRRVTRRVRREAPNDVLREPNLAARLISDLILRRSCFLRTDALLGTRRDPTFLVDLTWYFLARDRRDRESGFLDPLRTTFLRRVTLRRVDLRLRPNQKKLNDILFVYSLTKKLIFG